MLFHITVLSLPEKFLQKLFGSNCGTAIRVCLRLKLNVTVDSPRKNFGPLFDCWHANGGMQRLWEQASRDGECTARDSTHRSKVRLLMPSCRSKYKGSASTCKAPSRSGFCLSPR